MTDEQHLDCQLNYPPFHQCCCTCKHHLPVMHHCATSPELRRKQDGCCCGVQKGWACVLPGSGHVYDNWPEHSFGCELHEPKTHSTKEEDLDNVLMRREAERTGITIYDFA